MRSVKLFVLHICRLLGLFALASHWIKGQLLILCYHGFQIEDEAQFRSGLFISKERFERHLELLAKNNVMVLPLSEAIDRMYQRDLPEHAVTITIDDGFASVYQIGLPVLKKFRFPATVYVTSYYVKHPSPVFRLAVPYMFWKSRLDKLVLQKVNWAPDQIVDLGDKKSSEQLMWQCIQYGENTCSESQRQELLRELSARLKVDLTKIYMSRMLSLMTVEELRQLAENDIDIQLHTHRHRLHPDNEKDAKKEIQDNRDVLRMATGQELIHFCYPSGIWHERQWEWLDSIGIRSATTCDAGFNHAGSQRFALKRILVGDNVSDIEFLAEITGFSEMLRMIRKK